MDTSDHPVLLSRMPIQLCRHSRDRDRQLTAELFERFYVPSLLRMPDCVLSLMDMGKLTGMVVDCGHSVSHTSAVYEGYIVQNTVRQLNIGGKDVSEQLAKITVPETNSNAFTRSETRRRSKAKDGLQVTFLMCKL